jgi:hypothetical protein
LILPHHFEPRRTANWNIRLGFHHGQGLSSVKIAELLGDGTGPATVRTMIQGADLPSPGARMAVVPITFEYWQRDILQRHADERRITINELLYRMIASGLVLDDLYDAVTDGRYD